MQCTIVLHTLVTEVVTVQQLLQQQLFLRDCFLALLLAFSSWLWPWPWVHDLGLGVGLDSDGLVNVRRIWPICAIGQMRSAFNQAEHRISNLLPLTNCAAHLAIGANKARKPGDTQLRGTGATHRMVSRRRYVSRR